MWWPATSGVAAAAPVAANPAPTDDAWLSLIDWSLLHNVVSNWGWRILSALLIFLIGRWVARRIARVIQKAMTRAGSDPTIVSFIGKLGFGVLLVLVCVAALDRIGIPSASLVAAVGAAGLAIGLAMQGSLSNLASGVLLILFRPFSVGHYIDVNGQPGTVKLIGLMFTQLTTSDNLEVSIPNAQVLAGPIINYSSNPQRRIDLLLTVGYGSDGSQALAVIRAVIEAEARVMKQPKPALMLSNLGSVGVDISTQCWVNSADYTDTRGDLLRDIKAALSAAGIEPPLSPSAATLAMTNTVKP